jgi:hypothetical protein
VRRSGMRLFDAHCANWCGFVRKDSWISCSGMEQVTDGHRNQHGNAAVSLLRQPCGCAVPYLSNNGYFPLLTMISSATRVL